MRAVRDARYKYIRNLAPQNTYDIAGIHHGAVISAWQTAAKNDPKLAARVAWLSHRPAEELYDLETDEFEIKNRAGDPELAEIKAKLAKQLDGWMAQQGDKGMATEMLAPTRQGAGRSEGESLEKPAKKGKKGE